MQGVIPMTALIKELNVVSKIEGQVSTVLCTVFEDNNRALELANMPQMRPHTKHIALKYHHFRKAVKDGKVKVVVIDTKEQIADIFTKPLYKPAFEYLHGIFLRW